MGKEEDSFFKQNFFYLKNKSIFYTILYHSPIILINIFNYVAPNPITFQRLGVEYPSIRLKPQG